jgi:hypothetical protein
MRLENYLNEEVTEGEALRFKHKWRQELNRYGVEIKGSEHFDKDRLNDPRNKPPITLEELDWLLSVWFNKHKEQFKKDVEDIKKNIARPRGINKKRIPHNNLEWTISGSVKDRNNIHIVLALRQLKDQQGKGTKGTAILVIQSVIRTRNKKVTMGEYFNVGTYEYQGK